MAANITSTISKPFKSQKYFDPRLVALINRVTNGFTLDEYEEAAELGHEAYLERQLDPASIDDSETDARFTNFTTLTMTPYELKQTILATQPNDPDPINELQSHAILRATYSKRQLFERMVEFWTDHFNVDISDKSCRLLKSSEDRDVIRPNAMGDFGSLLNGSAHSPAMMFYLDNYTNVAGAPQENYGREIMELHTLGVTGPYTEDDVKEASRCLTGWTLYNPNVVNFGDFLYIDGNHDQGAKTVLGVDFAPGGGKSDGDLLLDLLATHPSTAGFVGGKLTRWLSVYEPKQELLDQVTDVFQQTAGDVKELIRTILSPGALEVAKPWKAPKFRRPFQFVAALMRAVGAQFDDADPANGAFLNLELEALGMVPFGWAPPTGYPDSVNAWGTSLRGRWSFANRLMSSSIPHVAVREDTVMGLLARVDNGDLPSQINALLTGGQMSFSDEKRLRKYFASFEKITWPVIAEAIALAATSPSFQYF